MTHELIIIPTIVVILSQAIKLITNKDAELSAVNIIGKYGGMPSSHTAYVSSLGLLIFLKDGLESTGFAIWLLFSIIVIRNALGLRQEVSRHSTAIESIASKTKSTIPALTHRMGHRPIEVMVGALFGLIVTFAIKTLI